MKKIFLLFGSLFFVSSIACAQPNSEIASAAATGDAEMQFQLGNYYLYNFEQDNQYNVEQAFDWFLKSAKNGNIDSQFYFSYYASNLSGPSHKAAAAKWFKKAADQGYPLAQYLLALWHDGFRSTSLAFALPSQNSNAQKLYKNSVDKVLMDKVLMMADKGNLLAQTMLVHGYWHYGGNKNSSTEEGQAYLGEAYKWVNIMITLSQPNNRLAQMYARVRSSLLGALESKKAGESAKRANMWLKKFRSQEGKRCQCSNEHSSAKCVWIQSYAGPFICLREQGEN